MKKNLNLTFLLSVFMVFYLSIENASAQWTSPGPDGGAVSLLTASGDTMYAVAGVFSPNAEYLYTSTDNGSNWSPIVSETWPATPYDNKKALAKIGNSLFVGTNNGIFRSDDNGLTWVIKYPFGPAYAFAGTDTALYAGAYYGILKSTDNGETWTFNDLGGVVNANISSLAVKGNNVYATSLSGITVHSENNGATYAPYEDIFFGGTSITLVGNDLYAGTMYDGVYKLTDCSGLWAQVYAPVYPDGRYIIGLVGDESVVFASSLNTGVVRSTDGGANWTNVTANGIVQYTSEYTGSPAVMTSAGVFVGTSSGIYKTSDTGNTWTKSDAGIHAHYISQSNDHESCIATLGTDVYTASYYGGVFRSTDDGQSFTDVSQGLSLNEPDWPGHPKMVGSNSTTLFSGAYMSIDNGTTWTPHNSPGHVGKEPWIELGGVLITISEFEGVYCSFDNGATWALSNNGINTTEMADFTNLSSDGTVLYLGGGTNFFNQCSVYYSTDKGANWQQSNCGVVYPGIVGGKFFSTGKSMLFCGANPGWGEYKGIWRTSDGGANWTLVLEHCSVMTWASSDNTIYMSGTTQFTWGTNTYCIYSSDDDGANWTLVTSPVNSNPEAFAVDGSNAFMGVGNGISLSKDKCATWESPSYIQNYPNIYINNITIFNNKIYASARGGSLLVRSLSDFTEPTIPDAIVGSSAPCRNSSQTYTVPNVPSYTYTWQFPSGWVVTEGGTTNSVTVKVGNTTGVVLVTPTNDWGSGSSQYYIITQTLAQPATPIISQVGYTLSSNASSGNQWYLNNTIIEGATNPTYEVVSKGDYSVNVSSNGCTSEVSNTISMVITGINDKTSVQTLSVYPNPSHGQFTLAITSETQEKFDLRILDNLGKIVYQKAGIVVNGAMNENIDLHTIPGGIYSLVLRTANKQVVRKIVIK